MTVAGLITCERPTLVHRTLRALFTCVVSALVLIFSSVAPMAAAVPGGGTVGYTALDPVTDNGVGGLLVTPYEWDGDSWEVVQGVEPLLTDPSGEALFELPPGSYAATIDDPRGRYLSSISGGFSSFPDGPSGPGVSTIADVNTGYRTLFRLERDPDLEMGVIVGRLVAGPDSTPYAGALVSAAPGSTDDNVAATRSGDGGPLFESGSPVEPGRFALAVEPGTNFVSVDPLDDPDYGFQLLPEVTVLAGQTRDLGDIQMRAVEREPDPVPARSVSVLVENERYDDDTDALERVRLGGIELQLYRWSEDEGWALLDVDLPTTDDQGQASFEVADMGDYMLGYVDPTATYSPGVGLGGANRPDGPGDVGTFSHDGLGGGGVNLSAKLSRAGEPGFAEVSGLVQTRGGDPLSGPILATYRWSGQEWVELAEALGDDAGRVSRLLSAGTYTFRFLRAGMEPVFLGGDAEMPVEPTADNSIVVGSDLAPVTLETVTLQRQRPTFGTAVAGEYGPDHDYCLSRFLPKNDDDSSQALVAPFPMTFFGAQQSELYVNNNGNVTFGDALGDYTPSAFGQGDSYDGPPIIAPFFADVDTWNDGSNVVTYGSNASGTKFCVNWTDVGYYDSWSDKLNSFQLILTQATGADRAPGDFDIQFNYDRILWETGDASSGSNGFGGVSALAGFTAGTPDIPGTVVQLPGSLVNGALLDSGPNALVRGTLNAGGRAGRYNFAVNNSGVQQRLGSLQGRVVTSDGASPDPVLTGVAGALVEPCRQVSGSLRCYGSARTDGDGRFTFVGLPGGVAETGAAPETAEPIVYTLRVSPPADSSLFPAVGSGGVKAGLANVVTDPIVMTGPRAVPAGVEIETDPTSSDEGFPPRVRDDGVLEMYWRTSLALSVPGCPEQTPTFSFTVGGTTVDSGPMTEVPGSPLSTYTATVQRPFPLAGDGSLTTTVLPSCAPDSAPVAFDVYIDPSGTVTDQFGMPLDDVTATLLRSDTVGGPFAAVPDGSAIMSPANRTNPDVLDSDGAFAWFVQSGVYRVDATRTGCDAASTEEMPVPPERLALLIKMQCDARTVSATAGPTLSAATARHGTALTVAPATWPAPIEPTRIEWRRGNTVVGTQATYTPTRQDVGQMLTVRTYGQRPDYRQENRDDGALVTFDESFASVQTAVVEALPEGGGGGTPANISNTAKPAVTGTAKVGGQLSADPGTWNTEGLTFGYQWSRDGAPIAGATGATYAPVVADLDKAVTVTVTASKTGLTSGTASADPVTVGKGAAPQNTGAKPLVTGTPEVGETLTVSDGTWDLEELTFAYQWLRDGEPIEGATAATYVVTTDDLGAELTARTTASKTGHDATGPLFIIGLPRTGTTLVARDALGLFPATPLKAALLEAVDFAIDRAH